MRRTSTKHLGRIARHVSRRSASANMIGEACLHLSQPPASLLYIITINDSVHDMSCFVLLIHRVSFWVSISIAHLSSSRVFAFGSGFNSFVPLCEFQPLLAHVPTWQFASPEPLLLFHQPSEPSGVSNSHPWPLKAQVQVQAFPSLSRASSRLSSASVPLYTRR